MSALSRILNGLTGEARSLENPNEVVIGAFGGAKTASGQTVSIRNSMGLVPVNSAVTQISSSVGSLPLIVYRRLENGDRERARDHRTWSMLHRQPNEEMGSDECWEIVMMHLLLWGNAFIWKRRDNLGLVRELWPLSPSRFQVYRNKRTQRREFIVDGDYSRPVSEFDILHIRGGSIDGLVGLSPIQEMREFLGVAKAQGDFQGRFLQADGKPSIVLRHPNKITPEAAQRLERSWETAKPGGAKLVEEGIEVERWTMPLEDAQFLESMQFSDLRVAQMFLLPPSLLGASSGDSLTYSSTESDGRAYVVRTLRRWLTRIEGSLRRDPSIFPQGDRFFAEFLVDALMRGDLKSRFESYNIATGGEAWMDVDEVRSRENLPRRDAPESGGE